MRFPSKYGRFVSAALLVIGAIPLIIMMIVVTANSLGRAIFKIPVTGTIEIAGLAGVIVVAAAVGFTARERANVAVDVLLSQLKPRAKRILDIVTLFLSFAAVCFLLYAIIIDALKSFRMEEVTMMMSFPMPFFKFAWAGGVFILACFLLVHLITTIRKRGVE
jgi:TRAP-type C4-dicarboxylate transport system permease small subunit